MITYQIKVEGLDTLQRSFARAPQLTMAKLADATNKSLVRLQATAKELAPVDQGILRGSILIDPVQVGRNRVSGSVGTNTRYAEYMERGTGIYGPSGTPIRPKSKPVLAWKKDGAWHFAKEVRGSRPRWYMRGSLERNTTAINGYYATAADEIAQAIATGGR